MQRKDGVKAQGEDSHLPVKEDLRLPGARRKTGGQFSLTASERTDTTNTLDSDFHETIYLCCLNHLACDTLLQQSQYSTLLKLHYLKLHCLSLLSSP